MINSCAGIMLATMVAAIVAPSCSSKKTAPEVGDATPTNRERFLGDFNADSAYQYIADQVACGPRVPGTEGHEAGKQYLLRKLAEIGYDSIMIQNATVTAYTGEELPITNIVVGYKCHQAKRVLIGAHWDTRPWADEDPNPSRRAESFDGANDGGSGTAVLLEIARNLRKKAPGVGVDLIFIDGEDYGCSGVFDTEESSWCLGTQHWVTDMQPYTGNANMPVMGIILDMVGGRDAKFYYEAFAAMNASTPTLKVWSEAEQLGFGDRFIRKIGGAVTDDHVVLTRAGIPTTDIIEINHPVTGSFNPTWHTAADNLSNIDKNTLKAVGQTVLNVIYKEKPF